MSILKKCLELCKDSYNLHDVNIKEVEALYFEDEEYQYIAFRGTEASKMWRGGGWRDVLRDLRTMPWYDKRVGWSHAGFLKGAREVTEWMMFNRLKDKPVVVTGHSLGGGLAMNCAAILHSEGYDVAGVVTFGSPKTFKWMTARKWRKTLGVLNYSNDGDPVPYVPTSWLGWRHVNLVETNHKPDGYGMQNHTLESYEAALND